MNFQSNTTEKNVAAVLKAAMPSEYHPYYKTLVEYYVTKHEPEAESAMSHQSSSPMRFSFKEKQ
jgi:hypothetical protein